MEEATTFADHSQAFCKKTKKSYNFSNAGLRPKMENTRVHLSLDKWMMWMLEPRNSILTQLRAVSSAYTAMTKFESCVYIWDTHLTDNVYSFYLCGSPLRNVISNYLVAIRFVTASGIAKCIHIPVLHKWKRICSWCNQKLKDPHCVADKIHEH